MKADVRTPASLSKPFKGAERRLVAAPKPKQQAAVKPFKAAPAKAPAPARAAPPTLTAKVTPAGGDEEWETF
jgi:hypothetical protein